MIEVFVEYSRQHGHRTIIPGGPFANRQDAYAAMNDFAEEHHGSFRGMVQVIDAYGFIVEGAPAIRNETKP